MKLYFFFVLSVENSKWDRKNLEPNFSYKEWSLGDVKALHNPLVMMMMWMCVGRRSMTQVKGGLSKNTTEIINKNGMQPPVMQRQ